MSNNVWTDDLCARVKALWPDHSARQISDILGAEGYRFTRNAIIGHAHRAKLSMDDKTEKPVARVPRPPRQPRATMEQSHVVTRIRAVNGNSNAKRIIQGTAMAYKPVCDEIVPRHLTLIERRDNECHYPYGGDRPGDPITFCGHPVLEGFPYCPHHHQIMHSRGTPSERAASWVSA